MHQNSNVSLALEDLFFVDENRGWIAGDSGLILHTTNGGLNWIKQNSGVLTRLKKIGFVSEKWGYASGSQHTRIITTNQGQLWIGSSGAPGDPDVDSEFWVTELKGAYSKSGLLLLTHDGGRTWCQVMSSAEFHLYDMKGVSFSPFGQIYWIVGNMKNIYGKNLIARVRSYSCFGIPDITFFNTEDSKYLNSISLLNDVSEIWTVGEYGKVLISNDSGKFWRVIVFPHSIHLNDVTVVRRGLSWIVGDSGIIARYSLTTSLMIDRLYPPARNAIILYPYPNPFNSTITMEMTIFKQANVCIKIYDILGRRVSTIFNAPLEQGIYKFIWDGKDDKGVFLNSGVYFVSILGNDFKKQIKIIFLK